MIWILIAALVVLSLVLLGVTLLGLWGRLKALTRTVGAMGALVEDSSASLALRPRAAPPAPADRSRSHRG